MTGEGKPVQLWLHFPRLPSGILTREEPRANKHWLRTRRSLHGTFLRPSWFQSRKTLPMLNSAEPLWAAFDVMICEPVPPGLFVYFELPRASERIGRRNKVSAARRNTIPAIRLIGWPTGRASPDSWCNLDGRRELPEHENQLSPPSSHYRPGDADTWRLLSNKNRYERSCQRLGFEKTGNCLSFNKISGECCWNRIQNRKVHGRN